MLNIEQALSECRNSAEHGYQLASEGLSQMQSAIEDAKSSLRESEHQQDWSQLRHDSTFEDQLRAIERLESRTIDEADSELKKLRRNQSEFTIILYGRTMAGKSTLMEILTHGNGKSIGNGSQERRAMFVIIDGTGSKFSMSLEHVHSAGTAMITLHSTQQNTQISRCFCWQMMLLKSKKLNGWLNFEHLENQFSELSTSNNRSLINQIQNAKSISSKLKSGSMIHRGSRFYTRESAGRWCIRSNQNFHRFSRAPNVRRSQFNLWTRCWKCESL